MTVNVASAVAAYRNAANKMLEPGLPARDAAATDSFGSMVKDAVASTADTLSKGEALSTAAVTNAELTLQTVVAVRDKVISAYQDIIRMPI